MQKFEYTFSELLGTTKSNSMPIFDSNAIGWMYIPTNKIYSNYVDINVPAK